MGLEENEKEVDRHNTEGLHFLARLLDPHLQNAERRNQAAKQRWSHRRAFTFILVGSLALWALAIWGIFYLIRLF